ncbi:30S ribosomal protein S20 [Aureibacillus halotolerans]|uniref:Small ribosomal subunit protein bS20 n=1 Tax=Aureibacillus halotolerans TaxID=1508390 RepID=A0A4R6TX12_9BACI|nr:30S ribosomal protein S20 [Aureibacillus halotolerans]TDQ38041.1 small subunit ribosomal protein S20 [Aureibacillus halotolerans]
MPNIKSAIKRVKTTENRRTRNIAFKSSMRTAVKKFETSVADKNVELATQLYSEASKQLDKAAQRNIIHKNTAGRQKSRLAKQLNSLSA